MFINEFNIKKLTLAMALAFGLSACAASGDTSPSSAASVITGSGAAQTTAGGPVAVKKIPRSCQRVKTRYSLDCTRK